MLLPIGLDRHLNKSYVMVFVSCYNNTLRDVGIFFTHFS
jgi:hypothetical protein